MADSKMAASDLNLNKTLLRETGSLSNQYFSLSGCLGILIHPFPNTVT